MSGAIEIAEQLQKILGIEFGETTDDGIFTLEWTNCIGMCDQGPAFLINDTPHTRVSKEGLEEIINIYRTRNFIK